MSDCYVLVTGAAGFIGSKVTTELISQGRKVIALDCFLENLYPAEVKKKRWSSFPLGHDSGQLVKLEFDLRQDDFSILNQFEIDSVINEAALPGLSTNWANYSTYYDCNLSALNRLLEYLKTRELRSFIQASTSSVYGRVANGAENQDLNPTSPYGVSKLAAEKLLLAYREWFGVPVKILRYFSVYGPNQRPDMAYAKIIAAIRTGEFFTIYGDGEQRRSNTYIDDIVSATLLSETKASSGQILNICGDEEISLNEAISLIEDLTGIKLNKRFEPMRNGDQSKTFGDNSLAKKVLGWEARVEIRKGIELQVQNTIDQLK